MNAYEMFQEIRDNIGESVAAHWSDLSILRKINSAQRAAFHLISQTTGDWFIKNTTLTPSNSQLTLPADCAKPVYLEDYTTGNPIDISQTIRERRNTRLTNLSYSISDNDAYMLEDVIELNNTSYTGNVVVWYERRIPDLHFGTASAGGATSLTLEASKQHSLQDDYYNGMILEVVSGTGAGARTAITDYAGSTRILTTATGTFGNDSVYGLVSELPRESCDFIILNATVALLSKPNSLVDPNYVAFFSAQLKTASINLEDWCSRRTKASTQIRQYDYYE